MSTMKLPQTRSNLKIKRAVKNLKKMPTADRIQLLVEAKLMSQKDADKAKSKLEKAG